MNDTDIPALPTPLRRLAAMVYDSLLVFAILMLAALPWVYLRGGNQDGSLNFDPPGVAFQLYIGVFLIGYFMLGWCRKGQTLGMRSWRMKVVSLDGSRISVVQALLRFAGALLAWLPAAAGIFWQYIDRDGLTWHDRLSATRVVISKKQKR